jgi:predicted O-linked N-acetylglucosamine transferase (SPINDLY family)
MATISEALAIAVQHHQAGRLQAAEQIYRQILAVEPNQPDAWHLLGVIAYQVGKHEIAADYIGRAIRINGTNAAFHSNLGNAFKDQGKLDEAAACYRRALELEPDNADAYYNLGNVLREQGKPDEAIACCRRAVQLRPNYAVAHNNLGNLLREQGHPGEAIASLRRTLELNPNLAEAHGNLGIAFKDLGKLDEAVASCRRALELKPDYAEAHCNLAAVLKGQKRLDEAVACYRRAVELKPGDAEAHDDLGTALMDQGKLDEAVACYRRALELKPAHQAAMAGLVHGLQHLCLWGETQSLSRQLIRCVDEGVQDATSACASPFTFLTLPTTTTAQQQLRSASRWADHELKAAVELESKVPFRRAPVVKSRVNIGYLSADFYGHATAWLIAELLEKHDRRQFSVFGYSIGPDDQSPTRRRLVNALDRFVDVRDASFLEAADRIAADDVDILVDLKGYTKDARTQILALRPAPIQVNYLGYPGTMGAPFMDYILVDDFIVPPDQQPFFSEKLVHLPGCYQVNDSRREISSRTPSRAECGLPEEGFVFCCFNNSYKITPEIFGVWMELLKQVPGSVLWLYEGNPSAPANLRREAEARGVASGRLVFAPRWALPDHLARHRLADLFLDTFPVNAHTTASDALWASCPVLTLAGETFVSRVAGSLLRTVGLDELVTRSLDAYQAMALRLARDAERLARLRARLEANRKTSRLFDAGRFARSIEDAYLTMWEIHASGQPPRAFCVSAAGSV